MRRPTINDVARAAGLSKSTVSLVLKNSPLVREETARDVRAVMARLQEMAAQRTAAVPRARVPGVGAGVRRLGIDGTAG